MSIDVEKVWTDIEAMLETSQAKDARIAELERERDALKAELAARPVVEGEAARKLRSVWGKMSPIDRSWLCDYWDTNYSFEMGAALRAFCESAPPASAASDARARILTEQLNELAKSHAVEGERWSREMGEKDAEVYTLRATLAAVNNQYDERMAQLLDVNNQYDERMAQLSEYQDRAMKEVNELLCAARAWLAAPLAQHSEYVRAAVEYAEAHVRAVDAPSNRLLEEAGVAYVAFRALYDARQRGEQEPVAPAPAPPAEFTTWLPADGPPAPAMKAHGGAHFNSPPAERVTVYAMQLSSGSVGDSLYSEKERCRIALHPGSSWLALDARVVREGGAA